MQKLSEKILSEYQIRKTKEQKAAFIELLKQYYPELQIEEGGLPLSRNIVIGDICNAEVVVTAHYDTCAKLPFPNLIAPKNILLTLLYNVLIVIPFMILMGVTMLLLRFCSLGPLTSYWISFAVMMGMILWVFMLGTPNEHTANDNTSGVIALCELLEMLTPEQRAKTVFVFFDNEEYGLLGSGYYRKVHKKQLKDFLLINLDCISDGDHLLVIPNKPARKKYEEFIKESFKDFENKKFYFEKGETTLYPSDQINFPVHMAISSMNRKPFVGFYMDKIHTKHDVVFDRTNIECICSGIQAFIGKLDEKAVSDN